MNLKFRLLISVSISRQGVTKLHGRRNKSIEKELQTALDNGENVWAIGDVHGHADTLVALLNSLDLNTNDRVVLLGDLVDRGPKSCEVIRIARESSHIFSVLGNHEEIMLLNFDALNIETMNAQQSGWFYIGGRATAQSYIDEFTDINGELCYYKLQRRAGIDLAWLNSLPHHIVLDDFRLVHAGYDPYEQNEIDLQSTDNLLWIRSRFHDMNKPVDENRTIVFGHSTMLGFGLLQSEIWKSEIDLNNGRSAAIGIDSCCYGGEEPQLTALNLQDGTVVKQLLIVD